MRGVSTGRSPGVSPARRNPPARLGARRRSLHQEQPLAQASSEKPRSRGPVPAPGWAAPAPLGLGLVFAVLALIVYAPSFEGEFISDDFHYVAHNQYIHAPSLDNLVAIWNPVSEVAELVENYAPVHLSVHAVEWQFFGPNVFGYHVVNVLLHALGAVLLLSIFRRSGIAAWPAALGAGVFLLHPANVEAVAWISQLKSSLALVLSLGAILWHPRRPALALVLFTLALLAKPFAASALVVVALSGWLSGPSAPGAARGRWLLGWLAVVAAFGMAEAMAFSLSAGLAPTLYADPLIRGGMILAVASRYAVMASFGLGLSTFHEPAPVDSLADPWLLAGTVFLLLLGWRVIFCLRHRRQEAIYWLWAAAGFAPLSGIVPLPYPMADRYLYFILPGLIGGVLLAGQQWVPALEARLGSGGAVRTVRSGLLAASLALLLLFGFLARERAEVFYSPESFMADAERNYPEGAAASTRKASRAARRGDHETALIYLRSARARGYNRVDHLLKDGAYGGMQDDPAFMEIKRDMAQDWIDRLGSIADPSHYKARALAQAYVAIDELDRAAKVLEAAAQRPGPIADELRADAEMLRGELAFRARLEQSRRGRTPFPD